MLNVLFPVEVLIYGEIYHICNDKEPVFSLYYSFGASTVVFWRENPDLEFRFWSKMMSQRDILEDLLIEIRENIYFIR